MYLESNEDGRAIMKRGLRKHVWEAYCDICMSGILLFQTCAWHSDKYLTVEATDNRVSKSVYFFSDYIFVLSVIVISYYIAYVIEYSVFSDNIALKQPVTNRRFDGIKWVTDTGFSWRRVVSLFPNDHMKYQNSLNHNGSLDFYSKSLENPVKLISHTVSPSASAWLRAPRGLFACDDTQLMKGTEKKSLTSASGDKPLRMLKTL
jgi:hypothetical protein